MQEASAQGILRTILILMLVYYGLKIIGRYVFPLLLKRTMNKMEARFRAQQQTQEPQEEIGKTTIDKKPRGQNKDENGTGEYIDYEEVE